MSTCMGYKCLSHEVPLESENWYNHGFERLNEALQNRDVIVEAFKHLDTLTIPPEIEWLQQHPNCHVVISDEYGDTYDEHGNIAQKEKKWTP